MALGRHIPVLVDEVVDALQVAPGGRYCDGTIGGGGHARCILQHSAPDGVLVGLDRDPDAIRRVAGPLSAFRDRVRLCHGNFAEVVALLTKLGMIPVDGVLLDLGVSSFHFDQPERGFSFSNDGPLDMRMDPTESIPDAAQLIAQLSEQELSRLIHEYGEEPSSRRIARAIKQAQDQGQIRGTSDLARVVSVAVGGRAPRRYSKIHPATRTFMALRMAVNDELGSLRRFLETFTETLRPGGRVAVIAFHSLEDRAVKQAFAQLANPCTCPPGLPYCCCGRQPVLSLVTRRPLRPGVAELSVNPRSRSARLRVAERL